jgi:hypothetical protein
MGKRAKSTKNSAKNKYVPKVAQICLILSNFGCFLPGNKDSNPCLEDPDFLSPAKKGQIPIPGFVRTLHKTLHKFVNNCQKSSKLPNLDDFLAILGPFYLATKITIHCFGIRISPAK